MSILPAYFFGLTFPRWQGSGTNTSIMTLAYQASPFCRRWSFEQLQSGMRYGCPYQWRPDYQSQVPILPAPHTPTNTSRTRSFLSRFADVARAQRNCETLSSAWKYKFFVEIKIRERFFKLSPWTFQHGPTATSWYTLKWKRKARRLRTGRISCICRKSIFCIMRW